MAYIELSDGVSNRRIQIPELSDSLRIELSGEHPHLIVSAETTIERRPPTDTE